MVALLAAALAASPKAPPPLAPCAATPLPSPPDRLAALAASDVEAVTAWRARVRTDVPVEVAPGVRSFAGNGSAGWRTVTVLADGPVVTILTKEGPFNLILGAEQSALSPVLTRPVALAPAAGVAAGAMRVELASGTPVRILAEEAGFTQVSWQGDHLAATGWVPTDTLGRVATPCPLPDVLHDVELVVGGPAIEVREAPGGRVLALVDSQTGWMGHSLGRTKTKSGSWTAVTWTEGGMRVAGYVSSARLKATARAHLYTTRRWLDVYGEAELQGTSVSVGEGTLIWRGDVPFARLNEGRTLPVLHDDGATVRVSLTTVWGAVEGTVACPRRSQQAGGIVCLP